MHSRDEWETAAQPVAGPAPTGNESGWVVHWPGTPGAMPQTDAAMPAYLRGIQNAYLNDPNRGYSIGYNFAVCNATGSVWEARGHDIRNAANAGGKVPGNHNAVSTSIQITCSTTDALTDAAVDSCNTLIATRPAFTVDPHSAVEWTACPGDPIRHAIITGRIGQHEPEPDPDPEGEPMQFFYSDTRYAEIWLVGAGPATFVTLDVYQSLSAKGVPTFNGHHDGVLVCYCVQSGVTVADLSPV